MNRLLLACLIFFYMNCLSYGGNRDEKLEHKITQIETELKNLNQQRKSILTDIYRYELIYEKELIKLRGINDQYNKQEQQISKLEKNRDLLNIKIAESKDSLKRTLRIMYKSRNTPYVTLFIGTESLGQLFRNYHYFASLLDFKSVQLQGIKQQVAQLDELEKLLQKEHIALSHLKLAGDRSLEEIQNQKKNRLSLMDKINHDRDQFGKLLEELKEQSGEIDKVIAQQPFYKKIETVKSENLLGKLPWPTRGKVLNRFGKVKSTQFNTFVYNNGIKIRPNISDQIEAVYAGVIVYSSYFKGYGNLLIVRHSKDLYTLYGYCSELKKNVDDWVSQGECIALVGDSGSTVGKALYFEVRLGVKSQDPLQWLRKK